MRFSNRGKNPASRRSFAVIFFTVLLTAVLTIPVAAAGNAITPTSPYPSAPNHGGRQPVTLFLEDGTEIRGFADIYMDDRHLGYSAVPEAGDIGQRLKGAGFQVRDGQVLIHDGAPGATVKWDPKEGIVIRVGTPDQQVSLKFKGMVGSEDFACGRSYTGIGVTKSAITPSDFRFYVSNLHLIDLNGKAVPVSLDQDGVWQYKNVALVDLEDGSGPCLNSTPGLHDQVTGTVPKGEYRGVLFTLGVPFELNHGDPRVAPAPLNLTAMFWVWQAGYKFVKIDMSAGQPQSGQEGSPARFSVHLGSTACASASKTTPPSGCANPNRVTVMFDQFDLNKNVVVADLASLLQEANVDVNAPGTPAGCMSSPNDGDCPPVMRAFGLPFGDDPADTQRLFFKK